MNKPLAKRLIKQMSDETISAIREDIQRDEYRHDSEIAKLHGVQWVVVAHIRDGLGLKPMTLTRMRMFDIIKHLRENPTHTDTSIAEHFGVSGATVAKYRRMLGIPSVRRGKQQPSDATLKARELLTNNPSMTDLEVSRQSRISFAHVARQRDFLGIPRSPINNRRPSPRLTYDYTAVDADIKAGNYSVTMIAKIHDIPIAWVKKRMNELGVRRRRALSPEERLQVESLLKSGSPRMTCKQIASLYGCSVSTIDKIRKEAGLRRLPPGNPKWEERRKAREMLNASDRKSLEVIARECGLSMTTVIKMTKDVNGEKWGV